MHIDEMRKAWERRPFRPFMIRMADGTALTVRHPENFAWSEETGPVVCVDLGLITSLDLGQDRKARKAKKG